MPQSRTLRRQQSHGFTLVEMLVVIVIFAVVVMAIFSLLIPTQQATVAQTRVAELQQGMRVALNVMTQDLLNAGFLVGGDEPIVIFEGNPAGTPPSDPDDFTIRTRLVGNAFGRVAADSTVGGDVLIGDDDLAAVSAADTAMEQNFPDGCMVRLFDPLAAAELTANGVYTVSNGNPSDGIIRTNYPGVIPANTVIVRIPGNATPVLQTIRYRFNDGALERIVNGQTQLLTPGLSGAAFSYEWTTATPQRVRRVDIQLNGLTQALKDDAISGAKERDARTSVTLRNLF